MSDGGFIVVGMTSSFGAGGWDAYIVKLDANGNKLWEKTFGGTNDDLVGRVVRTHDGGYILVGWTKSFGAGGSDMYIVKLDQDGSKQWERTYGRDRDDQAWSVQQTNEGGYIVAGWTKSFGTSMDAYVLKLDASGNKVWEKTFGGNKDDLAYSVEQTKDGGYVFAGWTQSFGVGQTDVYIIRVYRTISEIREGRSLRNELVHPKQSEKNHFQEMTRSQQCRCDEIPSRPSQR